MPGAGRTPRDERRRRLGQNFLVDAAVAQRLVAHARLAPGELIVEIGPGNGVLTQVVATHPVDVVCVEADSLWASRLRREARERGWRHVRVVEADVLRWRLPTRPFRVLANLPFGSTTAILHRLLDDPGLALRRADLVVQWEVARKRARRPPTTLLSASWAPWWEFRCGERIAAASFRPRPAVDAGVLSVTRRDPALLPDAMAKDYERFVRDHWGARRSGPHH